MKEFNISDNKKPALRESKNKNQVKKESEFDNLMLTFLDLYYWTTLRLEL